MFYTVLQAVPQISSPQPLAAPPSLPWLVNSFATSVQAGFPSPAEDHQVQQIDLMRELNKHPQATFMLRVRGDSMRDAGILDGAVVLVDKAIKPANGQIVIAVVDGDFTCKTLQLRAGRMKLKAQNPTYPDIIPKDGQTIEIWGVVVASIYKHKS